MNYTQSRPDSAEMLVESLRDLVEVVLVSMPNHVARLETGGRSPVLWLDVDSTEEDQCWAATDVLRALLLGPDAALHARWVRRLRAVS